LQNNPDREPCEIRERKIDFSGIWRILRLKMESKPASPTKEKTCERCGRFDAIEFGEHWLCPDCITGAGCACAEREDAKRPDSDG
jgi:hypothetical protein